MKDPLMQVGANQMEQAREDQVKNNAGGYVYQIDDLARAHRFLVLGTEGGTYYQSEREITRENTQSIIKLANSEQAGELLRLVLDVSLSGRAPKQNPTLFTLAALCASKNDKVRHEALLAIPRVCRTGTMLFIFSRYVQTFRGWGMGLRKGIARWYEEKDADRLAYQVTKYAQREGWSHRDLLRKAHPVARTEQQAATFDYVIQGPNAERTYPDVIDAVEGLKSLDVSQAPDRKDIATIITANGLSWEQVAMATNDKALNYPEIWEALVPSLGLTALVRQLGRLSQIGYLTPMSEAAKTIVARLSDESEIKKSLIHPIWLLLTRVTYAEGHGRGSLSWEPVGQVTDALDNAFYKAFDNVEPADKRTLIGLDVSGSMGMGRVAGTPLCPRDAAAALVMLFLRTEPWAHAMGFATSFVDLGLTPQTTLSEAVNKTSRLPFGATDVAQPMLWALSQNLEVDTFVVITDNETWAGTMHPDEALRFYRRKTGIDARLAVVGMTSTGFSVADPTDLGMMDFVGFDSALPRVLRDFSAREF